MLYTGAIELSQLLDFQSRMKRELKIAKRVRSYQKIKATMKVSSETSRIKTEDKIGQHVVNNCCTMVTYSTIKRDVGLDQSRTATRKEYSPRTNEQHIELALKNIMSGIVCTSGTDEMPY